MPMKFVTDCTAAEGQDINDMKDIAEEITRRTFLKYVDKGDMKAISEQLGYGRDFSMAGDWAIAYYKSFYRGVPCIYFTWSAIEHIFA